MRYVQINDSQGVVCAAFATANGVVMVLPMGIDANRIVVPPATSKTSHAFENGISTCAAACSDNRIVARVGAVAASPVDSSMQDAGTAIYQDATLQIRVTEDAQGRQIWNVLARPFDHGEAMCKSYCSVNHYRAGLSSQPPSSP